MTGRYIVRYGRKASRYLARLSLRERHRITEAIESFAREPETRALDVMKLTHRPEHRLRVGIHRVLFETDDDEDLMFIKVIRGRGDAYKR